MLGYVEAAVDTQLDLLDRYAPAIMQACTPHETQEPWVRGLRLLCQGLTQYFRTRFHEVGRPMRQALPLLAEGQLAVLEGVGEFVMGGNFRSLGQLDRSLHHLLRSAHLLEEQEELAVYRVLCYYQMGEVNSYVEDFEAAEQCYLIASQVGESLQNKTGLYRVYNGLANLYLATEKYEEAQAWLDKSLAIEGISPAQRSRSYCDLGLLYYQQGEYAEAERWLAHSYQLRMEHQLRDAASTSLIGLSKALIAQSRYQEALEHLAQALEITQEFRAQTKRTEVYHLMAQVHHQLQNWREAADAYAQHDALQGMQSYKQLRNIYRLKNDQILEQKQHIESIHRKVQASIRYAERIQNALLPTDVIMQEHLVDGFVIYQPKDIVAGDFYWVTRIGDWVLFAAADCTGHGVPGALMSVVCHNALNRAIREYGHTTPAGILGCVRDLVIQEFTHDQEVMMSDGMDIALCAWQGHQLYFSGAYNPLVRIRQGEVTKIRGDRQPIGKFTRPKPFTNHYLEVQPGDMIYLFTDGLPDQFGGPEGKKLTYGRLETWLLQASELPTAQQGPFLKKALSQWKGKEMQVDDMCLVGMRIP